MNRRTFVAAGVGAGLAGSVAAEAKTEMNPVIEITYIFTRNNQLAPPQQMRDFLAGQTKPALKKAGSGPVGILSTVFGPDNPRTVLITSYKNMAALESAEAAMAADKEYRQAREEFFGRKGAQYQRMERQLLRGFEGMPDIVPPPAKDGGGSHIFEMRRYESDNSLTLERKVGMFNGGEIDIFRKSGMIPVFFGHMLFGTKMPNLVYMLAYDDLEARGKCWSTFVRSPEWTELKNKPGLSDAEIVSNISNWIMSGVSGSDIR